EKGTSLPASYALLTFMIVVAIVVGILSLGGLLHQAAWPGQATPGAPTNSTTQSGGGSNQTGSNASSNGTLPLHPLSFPGWVPIVLAVVGVGVAVAVLAVYLAATRANPTSGSEAARAAVREEVSDALARLAASDSQDPR
ncbi:MAG: hypothetical protein L3K07_04885, partial [Thermoplasmata archaeon]|nr:hypothetical protein [Thermoplasmata archaeon]